MRFFNVSLRHHGSTTTARLPLSPYEHGVLCGIAEQLGNASDEQHGPYMEIEETS